MTTLVTGAGLVGTSYAIEAAARGERCVFLDPFPRGEFLARRLGGIDHGTVDGDARSLPALIDAIEAHEPDVLLHTAGLIGRRVAEPLHLGYGLNVGGAMAVAEAVRLTGVPRLVHLSTFGAYDWRRSAGTDRIDETFPLGSGAAYSNSKAAQELILEAYRIQCGFELVVLRPGNVFGMGHFWGGSGGGEKIHALVEAGVRGTVARVPEEQTMAFEYVYANDMGRALDLAATRKGLPARAVYNVSYGEAIAFERLVEAVKRTFPALEIEIVPGTPPASRTVPLDIARARAELGWEPSYTLEEAMADYAGEFRRWNSRPS